MISKMEQSIDEDQAVAASCLRVDVERWAEGHACYRCQKASWMMQRQDAPPARPGQPVPAFQWAIDLGACGAFMPVAVVMAMRPEGPFFCSAEKSDVAGGGFALASGERQGSGSAGWGEVQTPRQRGQGEGE